MDAESVMGAVTLFLTIFGGSMVVGLIYGVSSSIVYKKLDLRHHPEMVFMEVRVRVRVRLRLGVWRHHPEMVFMEVATPQPQPQP